MGRHEDTGCETALHTHNEGPYLEVPKLIQAPHHFPTHNATLLLQFLGHTLHDNLLTICLVKPTDVIIIELRRLGFALELPWTKGIKRPQLTSCHTADRRHAARPQTVHARGSTDPGPF